MKSKPLGIVLVALGVLAAWPLCAQPAPTPAPVAPDDPRNVVAERYKQMQDIIASTPDEPGMREKIKALTLEFVDYTEFSQLTVKSDWPKWNDRQRQDFVGLFRRLIQATYARHFHARQDLTVTYRAPTEYAEGRAEVTTTVAFKDSSFDVDYRFLKHPDGSWWVYDIVVDEVSLMRNYRTQFGKIMKRDGYDVLMKKLTEAVRKRESGEDESDTVE